MIKAEELITYKTAFIAWLISYGPRLIGALLVWFVGSWLINRFTVILQRSMKTRLYDVSLQAFLLNIFTIGLRILLLFSVAGMVGIQTTSFFAVLGALGLAMGLALQGSLANFAGGVLILIFKPFKVGNIIEAQGQTGLVKSIEIFSTVLETPSNKLITIPNGILSNGTIVNLTLLGPVNFEIKIELDESIKFSEAKEALLAKLHEDKRILSSPAPAVVIQEFTPKFIILVTAFTLIHDQLDTLFTVREQIKTLMESKVLLQPVPRTFITTVA